MKTPTRRDRAPETESIVSDSNLYLLYLRYIYVMCTLCVMCYVITLCVDFR